MVHMNYMIGYVVAILIKPLNNINRYHEYAGRNVIVFGTISIYNWMHMPELIDFGEILKVYHELIWVILLHIPEYCSPIIFKTRNILKKVLIDYMIIYIEYYTKDGCKPYIRMIFMEKPGFRCKRYKQCTIVYYHPDGIDRHTEVYSTQKSIKQMMEWIDFCLIARQNNEDIFELAPYLKEYKYANN